MKNFFRKVIVIVFVVLVSQLSLSASSSLASSLVDCYLREQCKEGAKQRAFTVQPEPRPVTVFEDLVAKLVNIVAAPRVLKKSAKKGGLDRAVAAQLNASLINNSVSEAEQKLILHHLKRFFSPRMLALLNQKIAALEWNESMFIDCDCLDRSLPVLIKQIMHLIHTLHLYSRQCAICLDPFAQQEGITVLPCNHYYHVGCIGHDGSAIPLYEPEGGAGSQPHRRCPLCRAPFVGGVRVMRL